MIYYINAYAPDTAMLALCVSRVRELDPTAIIYVANDPQNPVTELPRGCKEYRDTTPRQGNLNGMAFIQAQLESFLRVMEAEDAPAIVKMDADAWLNSVEWLEDYPEADLLFLERQEPLKVNGTCYRVTRAAARVILAAIAAREWPSFFHYPEDNITYLLGLRSGCSVTAVPYTDGHNIGYHEDLPTKRHAEAWCVHCGEPLPGGNRCPREMALLRMRVLAQAVRVHERSEKAAAAVKPSTKKGKKNVKIHK